MIKFTSVVAGYGIVLRYVRDPIEDGNVDALRVLRRAGVENGAEIVKAILTDLPPPGAAAFKGGERFRLRVLSEEICDGAVTGTVEYH